MSFQELVKKIREIFRELEIVDFKEMENYNYKNAFRNILYQNYDPPAYIVKIIMIVILKLKFVRSSGKVSWYSYFKFRQNYFKIRDYKFGTWTLEGLVDEKDMGKEILNSGTPEIITEGVNKDSEIYKTTLLIQKKIQKASKLFNKFFMRYILNTLDNDTVGNYYLNSSFNRLLNIYKFFEQNLIDSFKKFEDFKQGDNNRIKIEEINGEGVEIEVMGRKQIIKPMKLYLNIEGFTHYEKAFYIKKRASIIREILNFYFKASINRVF